MELSCRFKSLLIRDVIFDCILSLLIGSLSGNVFAACPASAAMSGKYSGQATYTELNGNSLDAVAEKLII
ncbi:hypothetical protein LBMAG43_02630 [Methylococcaceae bacterium]|nr:hypothetical protein LBMAG43_02630 [Methylococcaceae bacterium]